MPPRLDQIAELTRGIELPLQPLHEEHLRIIAEGLFDAWTDLLQRHAQVVLTDNEAAINALMETRLLARIEEDPLWAQMVRAVARGRETVSFDGTHLEKRPDLSLFLTCRNASFPMAIECKIVDEANDKSGKLYCDKGLSRFLTGEYAWATREAFMIAYVRDKSTIASALMPLLIAPYSGVSPYAAESAMVSIGTSPPDLAKSSHKRSFRYPLRQPPSDQPGAIALWHLWLPAT
ncbi:MAG TPA: hypothetical protein VN838_19105 [Bradyrhizobium sp.]|nr:hypothetical protein [Bradyrhizobium sp.]